MESFEGIVIAGQQLLATDYYMVASVVVLFWDHLLSFQDEVEHIWKKKKTIVSVLFLLNRYITPLGYIVNFNAYFAPWWTDQVCARFVKFEGVQTIQIVGTTALILMFRTFALYEKNIFILLGLGVIFVAEMTIMPYIMWHHPIPLSRPPIDLQVFRACILVPDPTLGKFPVASVVVPMVYDAVVFILTLGRTFQVFKSNQGLPLYRLFLRDGILYFLVIFAANFTWTMMVFLAPIGIQNINAHFSQIITVVMISRLTLNLKKAGANNSLIIGNNAKILPESASQWLPFHARSSMASNDITSPGDIQTP